MPSYPSRRYIRSKAGTTGITVPGQAVITAASAAAQRTILGLGTAATADASAFDLIGSAAAAAAGAASALASHDADTTNVHGIADSALLLTTTGNGSGLTNLNAGSLASGTVPTARLGSGSANASTALHGDGTWKPSVSHTKACLTIDFEITSGATNTTVLTLDLPVGIHRVDYVLSCYRSVATSFTPRIISGTAVLGGSTGDMAGIAWGGTGFTQVTLTKGTPDIFTLRGSGSLVNATLVGIGLLVEVTTAGTVLLQVSTTAANSFVLAGSEIEAKAQ